MFEQFDAKKTSIRDFKRLKNAANGSLLIQSLKESYIT